jgi:hypothetical protein
MLGVPRCRAAVLRVAPAITAMQISQFGVGTVINIGAAAWYGSPGRGCAMRPQILWIGALLYVAYGALFVRLFVNRYVRRRTKRAVKGGGQLLPADEERAMKIV